MSKATAACLDACLEVKQLSTNCNSFPSCISIPLHHECSLKVTSASWLSKLTLSISADPVIEEALNNAPECSCMITVYIDRTTWKDMNNNFRKSQDIQLTSVPTLIKVGTVSCAVLFSPAFCCSFPFTGFAKLKLLV